MNKNDSSLPKLRKKVLGFDFSASDLVSTLLV